MPASPSVLAVSALLALAAAAGPTSAEERSAALRGLADCRAAPDSAQRLACYDAAVAALDAAERAGDLVVVDREQAKAVRRQAFGFSLPSLAMFERGERPEDLDRVTLAVQRAYVGGDGKWTFELEGGAVWVQTDAERLARDPRKGSTVAIRKASMGSYFMNVDGQRAIRARRLK